MTKNIATHNLWFWKKTRIGYTSVELIIHIIVDTFGFIYLVKIMSQLNHHYMKQY